VLGALAIGLAPVPDGIGLAPVADAIAAPAIAAEPTGPAKPDAPSYHFENLQALDRLPWFETSPEGRLRVKDPTIGPIIDCHAHLALGFGPPLQVDLHAATPTTEHYLPTCCPVDLEPYANRNFSPDQLQALTRDLTVDSLGPGGMRRTHTAPNLLAEMNDLGIRRTLLLAIDMPFASDNAGSVLEVAAKEPRFIPFGSVHPHGFGAHGRLDAQAAAGARGLKFHPAVQMTRPDDARAMSLYKRAGEKKLVVFWHCGPVGIEMPLGRELSQVSRYERPIAENPDVTFVLGHAGALQADQALKLARRYPNVYLELSSQGLPTVKKLIAEAPEDRLLFGSDWPFYHAAVPLAKVLIATEGRPTLRRKVLHDNAARLLGLPLADKTP
jgi:predicted TIM-barrel fold metal-dependent hydrolase